MQVTTDSRNQWERMRRVELWGLAKAWGIDYPAGATAEQMVNILSASNVNPDDPKGAFEWETIHGQDEHGVPTVNRYPKRKVHATANKDIDYARVMEKNTVVEDENKSLKDEVAELKAMVQELTKTASRETTKSTNEPINNITAESIREKISDPMKERLVISDMKFHEMRKLAKSKGLKIPNTMKKPELIKELEALG